MTSRDPCVLASLIGKEKQAKQAGLSTATARGARCMLDGAQCGIPWKICNIPDEHLVMNNDNSNIPNDFQGNSPRYLIPALSGYFPVSGYLPAAAGGTSNLAHQHFGNPHLSFGASAGAAAAAVPGAATTATSPKVTPLANDVLNGRGRRHIDHPGNIRYGNIIASQAKIFLRKGNTRKEKTRIVQDTFDLVREGGRFLRFDDNMDAWVVLDHISALGKVGHALRYFGRDPARKKARADKPATGQRRRKPPPPSPPYETALNRSLVARAAAHPDYAGPPTAAANNQLALAPMISQSLRENLKSNALTQEGPLQMYGQPQSQLLPDPFPHSANMPGPIFTTPNIGLGSQQNILPRSPPGALWQAQPIGFLPDAATMAGVAGLQAFSNTTSTSNPSMLAAHFGNLNNALLQQQQQMLQLPGNFSASFPLQQQMPPQSTLAQLHQLQATQGVPMMLPPPLEPRMQQRSEESALEFDDSRGSTSPLWFAADSGRNSGS